MLVRVGYDRISCYRLKLIRLNKNTKGYNGTINSTARDPMISTNRTSITGKSIADKISTMINTGML